MGEPYNLLAIDPGSEKSTFLWCRVTPPKEWALPFGVEPRELMERNNRIGYVSAMGRAVNDPAVVAVEYLRGLFMRPGKRPGVVGRDQLAAQFWAGLFCGTRRHRRCRRQHQTRAAALWRNRPAPAPAPPHHHTPC